MDACSVAVRKLDFRSRNREFDSRSQVVTI